MPQIPRARRPNLVDLTAFDNAITNRAQLQSFLSDPVNQEIILSSPTVRQAFITSLQNAGMDDQAISDVLGSVAASVRLDVTWS